MWVLICKPGVGHIMAVHLIVAEYGLDEGLVCLWTEIAVDAFKCALGVRNYEIFDKIQVAS